MKVEHQDKEQIALRMDPSEVMNLITGLGYKAAIIEYTVAHSPAELGQHPHYEASMKMGAELSTLAFGDEAAWNLALDGSRSAMRVAAMIAENLNN